MKKRLKPPNHPFDECLVGAQRVVGNGGTIFQKWTCAGCGVRCRSNVPNQMAEVCTCEDCGATTDVRKHGCNFTAILTIGGIPR
jgi:hypothetical protein